jgi:hypothetical protein
MNALRTKLEQNLGWWILCLLLIGCLPPGQPAWMATVPLGPRRPGLQVSAEQTHAQPRSFNVDA